MTFYRIYDIGINAFNTNDPASFSAANSGPYVNITFDTGSITPSSTTQGAYLGYTTHGIKGMTCITGTASGQCIYVAAPGNTVEDVRVIGFTSGVDVSTSDTVVRNVVGDTNPTGQAMPINVVLIGSSGKNVVLIGISNNCSNTTYCPNDQHYDLDNYTIKDSVTGTNLQVASDPYVAMYVVGNQIGSGTSAFYSRYTTSPTVPNWSSGNGIPSGTCTGSVINNGNTITQGIGGLYSNTGSGGGLYVCSAVTSGGAQSWVSAH